MSFCANHLFGYRFPGLMRFFDFNCFFSATFLSVVNRYVNLVFWCFEGLFFVLMHLFEFKIVLKGYICEVICHCNDIIILKIPKNPILTSFLTSTHITLIMCKLKNVFKMLKFLICIWKNVVEQKLVHLGLFFWKVDVLLQSIFSGFLLCLFYYSK